MSSRRTKRSTKPGLSQAPTIVDRWNASSDTLRSEPLVDSGRPAALGSYQLGRLLGQGATGSVFAAQDLLLRREVAIKVLSVHPSRIDVVRFHREGRAVAKLDHPGIVRIHQVAVQEGRWYMVLDLVPGGSLSDRLHRHGPFAPRVAVRLIRDVARALEHAHERGVVHRDIKPANVLLTENGDPRLTDFGLVKELNGSTLTRTGQILGTPGYMPPEQALGRPADLRSDIYSVGATLYALLTGRPPFAGNAVRVLSHVVERQPTPPSLVAPVDGVLERICLKCLEKDPEARYPSAAALADDLDAYLESASDEPARAWRMDTRWVQAGIGAILVAAAAAATALVVTSLQLEPAPGSVGVSRPGCRSLHPDQQAQRPYDR